MTINPKLLSTGVSRKAHRILCALAMVFLLCWVPALVLAAEGGAAEFMDLTTHWAGYVSLGLFFVAYALVIVEEGIHLRKSKPVIVAAGLIWVLVAIASIQAGDGQRAAIGVRHNLLEYVELFLFLLAAMTYINTMEERGVFHVLRSWLVTRGLSLKQIFWVTGLLAFFISPVADNLTTALVMTAVVIAVGGSNHRFVAAACLNVVVAANAGGAFSPFGDITTLMVWQKGIVKFWEFFDLFIPSVVNWGVTAVFLSFAVPRAQPEAVTDRAELQYGAIVVVALFLLTIAMAVVMHNTLHLPPVIGMMTGLGFLKLYGYFLTLRDHRLMHEAQLVSGNPLGVSAMHQSGGGGMKRPFDIYTNMQRAEWDTLMFFYGVILCVGGLGAFGYLAVGSEWLYVGLGPTTANILVGIVSAVVDNIPVMFAVLTMDPDMSLGQWLLVTLTAGVGGSLLSIGSAAGVAVMGAARGIYTFFSHLKWTWAVALGYVASIAVHFWVNADTFQQAVGT